MTKNITKTLLGIAIRHFRLFTIKMKLFSTTEWFEKFLCEKNIYYLKLEPRDTVVKIKDQSFFDEYYSYYKYLYEPKWYYVWYKTCWKSADITNTTNKKRKIPKSKKQQIKDRDGNKCVICKGNRNLTIDHIIPLNKSGDNTYYNLTVLCEYCNLKKGDKIVKGFAAKYVIPNLTNKLVESGIK
jgi:5-methylcytosine-specific restriction endonuclease McrA